MQRQRGQLSPTLPLALALNPLPNLTLHLTLSLLCGRRLACHCDEWVLPYVQLTYYRDASHENLVIEITARPER